jgi:hypothetical protein
MNEKQPACIVCSITSQEAPLVALEYRQAHYYICPQHLPTLIHKPQNLVGLLPGAEQLQSGDHDH